MNAHSCKALPAGATFDPRSGSLIERALFNHPAIVVALCLLVTAALGWHAPKLQLNASLE